MNTDQNGSLSAQAILCPRCKITQTIDHNGGRWCPHCGAFGRPPAPEYIAFASKSRRFDWIQRQADGFDIEMRRQKQQSSITSQSDETQQPEPMLTTEEIARLSEPEFQIHRAHARAKKRNKQLRRRQDPLDRPGQSGGYQTTNLP